MINVVGAIIKNQAGDYFIAQRPQEGLNPNLWEFIGGKQDEGETLEECLVREVYEEAGLVVEAQDFFMKDFFLHKGNDYCLYLYYAKLVDDKDFCLYVHQDYRWAKLDELKKFDFCDADKKAVEML